MQLCATTSVLFVKPLLGRLTTERQAEAPYTSSEYWNLPSPGTGFRVVDDLLALCLSMTAIASKSKKKVSLL